MADELFVYGTLHPDRAPGEIAGLVRKLCPVGSGTIRGTLYNFGSYPGVVVNGRRNGRVAGYVYTLPDGSAVLASLDDDENFRPADPVNSLFLRAKRIITLANGKRQRCWVYFYNGKLPQAD